MTKKRVEGAKLTAHQKQTLKNEIYAQFPDLKLFPDAIDHLVEEYSERNRNIASDIMKNKQVQEAFKDDTEQSVGEIRTIEKDSAEYYEVMRRFDEAHQAERKRQEEIAEKAKKEMAEKGLPVPDGLVIEDTSCLTIGASPVKNVTIENI